MGVVSHEGSTSGTCMVGGVTLMGVVSHEGSTSGTCMVGVVSVVANFSAEVWVWSHQCMCCGHG